VSVLNIKSHDFLVSLLRKLRFLRGILFYIITKITKFEYVVRDALISSLPKATDLCKSPGMETDTIKDCLSC
jgi:hypothetical protein